MTTADFTTTLIVDQTPEEAFNAINDVYGWWSEDFKGKSQKEGDEFEVRFGDVHYSRQKLVDVLPGKKVAWLVTDSRLNFLQNMSEWTGTTIVFQIAEERGKTQVQFTHIGLVPAIECYRDCSKGWNYFLPSLVSLITTGKGQPNKEQAAIRTGSAL